MSKRKKREKRNGFTILELMAVVIIIGLLAAVVVTNVAGRIDKARVTATKASLKKLHESVNQFKMDTGRYPTEEEGLYVLVEPPDDDTASYQEGGYLQTTEVPKDAWGEEFIYERFPPSGKPFVVKSLGADKQEGGEGINADLASTDAD